MRRVGNNWRITLHMSYKINGACRGIRTHGTTWHSESCRLVNIPPKKDAARGALR